MTLGLRGLDQWSTWFPNLDGCLMQQAVLSSPRAWIPPPPGASSVVSVVLEKIVVILDLLMKLNAVPGIS